MRLDSARYSSAMHNTISYTCAESMNMSSINKLSESNNVTPKENNLKSRQTQLIDRLSKPKKLVVKQARNDERASSNML